MAKKIQSKISYWCMLRSFGSTARAIYGCHAPKLQACLHVQLTARLVEHATVWPKSSPDLAFLSPHVGYGMKRSFRVAVSPTCSASCPFVTSQWARAGGGCASPTKRIKRCARADGRPGAPHTRVRLSCRLRAEGMGSQGLFPAGAGSQRTRHILTRMRRARRHGRPLHCFGLMVMRRVSLIAGGWGCGQSRLGPGKPGGWCGHPAPDSTSAWLTVVRAEGRGRTTCADWPSICKAAAEPTEQS